MVRNQANFLVCALFCSLYAGTARADGAVYAMTNALGNNEILVYHRAASGDLTALTQTIATGGGGSGLQLAGVNSLGSAGSLQLNGQHHLLFAVNTESAAENNGAGAYNTDCEQGTITSFVVAADGTLTFADRVFSGGLFPNSLAVSNNGQFLFVLNAGGPEAPAICHLQPASANTPNITSFTVSKDGKMEPVGASQSIDPGPASASSGVECTVAAAVGFSGLTGAPSADFQCGLNPPSFARSPGQIRLTPDGTQLVATVKGTNTIYVFSVGQDGTLGAPTQILLTSLALPTPLGVAFDAGGHLLVAELFGSSTSIPRGGAGAVSSYSLTKTNAPTLLPINSHVGDGGTAAQSIVIEPVSGKFAYVSNNLSASISSYRLGSGGSVTLLNATLLNATLLNGSDGSVTLLNGTAAPGSGPNDLATAVETVSGGMNLLGTTLTLPQQVRTSFLYVLDAGTGTVGAFKINGDGSLTAITGGSGLPAGRSAQGLAAY